MLLRAPCRKCLQHLKWTVAGCAARPRLGSCRTEGKECSPGSSLLLWSASCGILAQREVLRRWLATRRTPSLEDHSPIQGVSQFLRHIVSSRSVKTRSRHIVVAPPCGPAVDWLRRSTVGSGTCEDVASVYEMTVLLEVVYISPVPAVIAVPALAALRLLRHRTSTCRVCSVFAYGLTKCL